MPITGAHIAMKIGNMSPVLVPGLQSWSAEDAVQELDGTTAEGGGYEQPDFGLKSLRISAQLVIDILAGDLVTIQSGTAITNLKLYAHISATSPIYVLPAARVFKSTPKGEVNGRFTYDVEIRSVGSFTLNNPSALPL
jgi:hypothetical protein